jgi:transposase
VGILKQVVLGIVLDDADRPIASFLMPGHTADVTLLLPVVKRLRERFEIREACIVADRGMISADTIVALEAEKIEYILGVRERTSREVRAEIIEDDGLAVPLLIPGRKSETELAVRETRIAGRRYVICRNAEEATKDPAARAELVAGLERKLACRQQGLSPLP